MDPGHDGGTWVLLCMDPVVKGYPGMVYGTRGEGGGGNINHLRARVNARFIITIIIIAYCYHHPSPHAMY